MTDSLKSCPRCLAPITAHMPCRRCGYCFDDDAVRESADFWKWHIEQERALCAEAKECGLVVKRQIGDVSWRDISLMAHEMWNQDIPMKPYCEAIRTTKEAAVALLTWWENCECTQQRFDRIYAEWLNLPRSLARRWRGLGIRG